MSKRVSNTAESTAVLYDFFYPKMHPNSKSAISLRGYIDITPRPVMWRPNCGRRGLLYSTSWFCCCSVVYLATLLLTNVERSLWCTQVSRRRGGGDVLLRLISSVCLCSTRRNFSGIDKDCDHDSRTTTSILYNSVGNDHGSRYCGNVSMVLLIKFLTRTKSNTDDIHADSSHK